MNRRQIDRLDRELREYVESLTEGMGRKERVRAMGWYVTGLLLDGERKSIEPIAARLVDDAGEIQAMRQRLQECVTVSTWKDEEVYKRLALKISGELPGIEAFVLDDTGYPKKGKHSVGVARQYSGTLGRVDNCQVAVSLHLAGEDGSACIGLRLYLPEEWAKDSARRKKAGIPSDIQFEPKWKLALEQLDCALDWGLARHVVLADAGYGDTTEFRQGLRERQLNYVVGVQSSLVVWAPGTGPIPPRPWTDGRNRIGTRYRTGDQKPLSLLELAKSFGKSACRRVTWREGSKGKQRSRFNAIRIRTAHRHTVGRAPGPEEWLLYEWPEDEQEPTKYWLATLPPETSMKRLVYVAKLRWRIERDYQDLKEEIGLDHFEGRNWRGFHHHATLCAVAHGFLAIRRALFPPEQNALDAA
jgi:SRSO17 transposase